MKNFLNDMRGLPHGEERFGEVEARLEPRTRPMQRKFLLSLDSRSKGSQPQRTAMWNSPGRPVGRFADGAMTVPIDNL
jgi:hypothetical protein